MKPTTVVLTIALAIELTAGATAGGEGEAYISDSKNYTTEKVEKAARNYLTSLNMQNHGVVESALAQVAAMKLAYPTKNYLALKEKIVDLVTSGATPSIRYKASVTLMVFENPEMFSEVRSSHYADGDQFFVALANRIQESLFAGSL